MNIYLLGGMCFHFIIFFLGRASANKQCTRTARRAAAVCGAGVVGVRAAEPGRARRRQPAQRRRTQPCRV